jgi:hypothetical protein
VTRDEAEVALYVIDELKKRGAVVVDVGGIKANFAPVGKPPDPNRPPRREKTERERLFGRLGIGDAKPAKGTAA